MRMWRKRNTYAANLVFLCEHGPSPRANTDGEQNGLSDRWARSLAGRHWIGDIGAYFEAGK